MLMGYFQLRLVVSQNQKGLAFSVFWSQSNFYIKQIIIKIIILVDSLSRKAKGQLNKPITP